jgi:hypothetical protein
MPEAERKPYTYLLAYVYTKENGAPIRIEPGVPYTSVLRTFYPSPLKIDSEEKVRMLERALALQHERPCMIVGISPLF